MEGSLVEGRVRSINCATSTGFYLLASINYVFFKWSLVLVVGVLMGKTSELSSVRMSSL